MRLSKASTYGLFAILYIAKHDADELVQGRAIADACGIPVEYLLKILQQLARARVILSERGRRGGFQLRKSATEITVLEIVEALEGAITGELPVPDAIAEANSMKRAIEELCRESSEFARSLLGATSIEQLINSEPSPPVETAHRTHTPGKAVKS